MSSEHGKVQPKFVIERQGKQFVMFAGLLDLAHQEGLKRIETTLLQSPTKENGMLVIVKATVETDKGSFSAIGDAAPDSVNKMIVPHIVRMAETRSIGRALRFATNVGATTFEELGEGDVAGYDDEGVSESGPRQGPRPGQQGKQDGSVSEKQRKMMYAIYKGKGYEPAEVEKMCQDKYGVKIEGLNVKSASEFIDIIKELPEKAQGKVTQEHLIAVRNLEKEAGYDNNVHAMNKRKKENFPEKLSDFTTQQLASWAKMMKDKIEKEHNDEVPF